MKRINLLATAILASTSTHAAFDQGNAILFAYDANDDGTYFVDLGVTANEIRNGEQLALYDAGLAAFLAGNPDARWGILGTINQGFPVAGPPSNIQSNTDSGFISSSSNGILTDVAAGIASGVDNSRVAIDTTIQNVQDVSQGLSSVYISPYDMGFITVQNSFRHTFENSLSAFGTYTNLYYAQLDPSYGATIRDDAVVSEIGPSYGIGADIDGNITNTECYGDWAPYCFPVASEVPIPAAAWLFGSALAGLLLARRKSV